MNIDTEKLLNMLKESDEPYIEVEKEFFISIIGMIEQLQSTIKVEEVFNHDKKIVTEYNNQTIINSGELLDKDSDYHNLTGDVFIDIKELKALIKDNLKHIENIKHLQMLSKDMNTNLNLLKDRLIEERKNRDLQKIFNNSLNSNIKIILT